MELIIHHIYYSPSSSLSITWKRLSFIALRPRRIPMHLEGSYASSVIWMSPRKHLGLSFSPELWALWKMTTTSNHQEKWTDQVYVLPITRMKKWTEQVYIVNFDHPVHPPTGTTVGSTEDGHAEGDHCLEKAEATGSLPNMARDLLRVIWIRCLFKVVWPLTCTA